MKPQIERKIGTPCSKNGKKYWTEKTVIPSCICCTPYKKKLNFSSKNVHFHMPIARTVQKRSKQNCVTFLHVHFQRFLPMYSTVCWVQTIFYFYSVVNTYNTILWNLKYFHLINCGDSLFIEWHLRFTTTPLTGFSEKD